MNKNFLIFIIAVCISTVLQPFEVLAAEADLSFVKTFGSTGSDSGKSIALGTDGSIYTTGRFVGTVDFDPGAGTSTLTSTAPGAGPNVFVSKLDASGNFVWAKRLGTNNTSAFSIALDSSDNVYITGLFTGTGDFDPGAGTTNLTSTGSGDMFVSKLDASGNFVWAKQMGGISNDSGESITTDLSGNVYVAGSFQNTVDFDPGIGTSTLTSAGSIDTVVLKLDSAGNFIWAKAIGGATGDDGTRSIKVDGTGNIYLAGYFYGTADFDPGAGTSNLVSDGASDAFISKLDSSGDLIWVKKIGGAGGDDLASSIVLDGNTNLYITGYFTDTVDFDPGAGTANMTPIGSYDTYVLKFNLSGEYVWAKQVGGIGADVESNTVALDVDGGVYVGGFFAETTDFDPGAETFILTTSPGSYDAFLLKLTSSGAFVYAKKIAEGTVESYVDSIALDPATNIYLTGTFIDTVDFDPGVATLNVASLGSYDSFIVKLDAGPIIPTVSTSPASSVEATTVMLNASLDNTGGENSSQHGFIYSLVPDLSVVIATTTLGPKVGTGSFSDNLTGLTPSTEYYVRAYATNSAGTSYGSIESFTTTIAIANILVVNTLVGPIGGSASGPEYVPESLRQPTWIPPALVLQPQVPQIPLLKLNTKGDGVKELQKFLNTQGFLVAKKGPGSKGKETTLFGRATKAAVIKFQKTHNIIPADGVVGPKTKEKINELAKSLKTR